MVSHKLVTRKSNAPRNAGTGRRCRRGRRRCRPPARVPDRRNSNLERQVSELPIWNGSELQKSQKASHRKDVTYTSLPKTPGDWAFSLTDHAPRKHDIESSARRPARGEQRPVPGPPPLPCARLKPAEAVLLGWKGEKTHGATASEQPVDSRAP